MPGKHHLHEYQKFAVRFILEHPYCSLFLDMGLGKTISVLTAIDFLMYGIHFLEIETALVVAPKKVVDTVWQDEGKKWSHVKHLTITKIVGTPKQRVKALNTKSDIHLISCDNIAWLCQHCGGTKLPFEALIIDESSKFKNHRSARFKALKKITNFKRIILMSGTPTPNGLVDLWAPQFLLDRGQRLGYTIGAFREKYFHPTSRKGHIVFKYAPRNKEQEQAVHDAIKDITISMKAVDYLDMPEHRVIDRLVQFSESEKLAYDIFAKTQVAQLADTEITAVNAAVLVNKLLQFANGSVYDEFKQSHIVHDLKLDELENIVEENNGKPVLVAWTYKQDAERIHKRFKKQYRVRAFETNQDKLDWNRGLIDILTMHPASGGHGINLQEGGNTIVWYGQTWSLELYKQLNARLYRQGQIHSFVAIYRLLTEGTADRDVINSVEGKNTTQEALLKATRAILAKYS